MKCMLFGTHQKCDIRSFMLIYDQNESKLKGELLTNIDALCI